VPSSATTVLAFPYVRVPSTVQPPSRLGFVRLRSNFLHLARRVMRWRPSHGLPLLAASRHVAWVDRHCYVRSLAGGPETTFPFSARAYLWVAALVSRGIPRSIGMRHQPQVSYQKPSVRMHQHEMSPPTEAHKQQAAGIES
jgi:hypothetical protein